MAVMTRTHTENISPTKAELWLDENYSRQRPFDARRVQFYADEMRKGRWQPTNPIVFALLDGDRYLVNGQHTLEAIRQSGVTVKYNPVHYHEVEEESDMDHLYAHHDIGKARTYSDSLEAYRVVDRTGLHKSQVNKLSAAIRTIQAGIVADQGRRRSLPLMANQDLIQLVMDRRDDFVAFDDAISPCDTLIRKKLQLAPVLAVALVTVEYQRRKALEFWSQVAKLDGLSRRDPRMTLHKALLVMQRSGGPVPDGYEHEHFASVAAYAWNKWYRNVPLTTIRPTVILDMVKRNGFTIDGTPYDGKNNPT